MDSPSAEVQWTRCMEYLPQKRRHCTGVRKAGSDFCGAHVKEGRIPCPVDPSHTIFARDVDKHVPRCTRTTALARMTALPCYVRGINAGGAPAAEVEAIAAWRRSWDDSASPAATTVSVVEPEKASAAGAVAEAPPPPAHAAPDGLALARMLSCLDLPSLAARVDAWHAAHCAGDQAGRGEAWGAAEDASGPSEGRHERQARRIAAALLGSGDVSSLASPPLLVEFGAGKGLLGSTAQVAVAAALAGRSTPPSSPPTPELLLVERGANRSKTDSRPLHGGGDAEGLPRQRIRMDIADMALERHPAAWGVRLGSLAGEPWVNAAGHDRVAEGRSAAASSAAEISLPGCKRRRASGGGGGEAAVPLSVPAGESAGTIPAVAAAGPSESAPLPHAAVPLCALGKHLCGGATDLALRCLSRAVWGDALTRGAAGDDDSGDAAAAARGGSVFTCPGADLPPPPPGLHGPAPRLAGIAIATCCHHSCGWGAYVGKEFFRRVLGAGPADFEALRMLSSWGCMPAQEPPRSGQQQQQQQQRGGGGGGGAHQTGASGADAAASAAEERRAEGEGGAPPAGAGALLDRAARVALGRRCKSLLDAGRVWFLRTAMARADSLVESAGEGGPSSAATVRMVPYCSGVDSPENMLLLLPLTA